MSAVATVLFQRPQQEIASLIRDRIEHSLSTKIVTGFATPGGLAAIQAPLLSKPARLDTLIVGAATYPAFEVLDDLITAGVPKDRLRIHLGHSQMTGGKKNPFARYHPMLHSKVYYMDLPDSKAAAFVGSHNLTAFALAGLNGEASIMLEGDSGLPEFETIRLHIAEAKRQAVEYSSDLKDAYAWWSREYLEGLRAEMNLPQDWTTVRTIIVFASVARGIAPKIGDQLYFEIPTGIEQIQTLTTEVHLFLFNTLPGSPTEALVQLHNADARFTCQTLGAENRRGNREVVANWRIDRSTNSVLHAVPTGIFRPTPPPGMQQVRAEIAATTVTPFEYQFERERVGWDPLLSETEDLSASVELMPVSNLAQLRGSERVASRWQRVEGLAPRLGVAKEVDQAALRLAAPDSGAFILVSLRRRRKGSGAEVDLS